MRPHARDHPEPQELGAAGRGLPRAFRGGAVLRTPTDFWPPDCERAPLCGFKLPSLWPFVTTAPGKQQGPLSGGRSKNLSPARSCSAPPGFRLTGPGLRQGGSDPTALALPSTPVPWPDPKGLGGAGQLQCVPIRASVSAPRDTPPEAEAGEGGQDKGPRRSHVWFTDDNRRGSFPGHTDSRGQVVLRPRPKHPRKEFPHHPHVLSIYASRLSGFLFAAEVSCSGWETSLGHQVWAQEASATSGPRSRGERGLSVGMRCPGERWPVTSSYEKTPGDVNQETGFNAAPAGGPHRPQVAAVQTQALPKVAPPGEEGGSKARPTWHQSPRSRRSPPPPNTNYFVAQRPSDPG